MTKKEYFEFHSAQCQKMIEITKAKNADYTGKGDDPFANFSNVKACGGATPEQGFLVRMNDKFMRISSFVQKGFLLVKDESVEDTLMDLANYCILLAGYLKSERDKYHAEGAKHGDGLDSESKKHADLHADTCTLCTDPPVSGYAYCVEHLEIHSKEMQKETRQTSKAWK